MKPHLSGRVHDAAFVLGLWAAHAALAQDACVALPPIPERIEVSDDLGAFTLGDLDLDGDLDVVITLGGAQPGIAVLRNLGLGRLGDPEPFAVGIDPWQVQLADLDGDGDPDVVVLDQASIFVVRNDGSGFASPQEISVRSSGVQIGDADGDGDPDLFVMQSFREYVGLLLNDGTGSFTAGEDIQLDDDAGDFAAGDADDDGITDLLVHYFGSRTTAMVYGVGDGTYEPPVNRSYGDRVRQVELADVDGDGDLDEVANGVFDNFRVRRNEGDRSFAAAVVTPTIASSQFGLVARDVNGDGAADLVQPLRNFGLVVHLATGDGLFGQARVYDTDGESWSAIVGDVDGDGDEDVVAKNFLASDLQVLPNRGDGRLAPAFGFSRELGATGLVVLDYDGDGTPDVATGEGFGPGVQDVAWYRGVGGGLHEFAGQLAPRSAVETMASADLDGNGTPDLVGRYNGRVSVMLNDGAGGFGPAVLYDVGGGTPGLDVGDIDGDGFADIVTTDEDARRVVILRNNGDGTFADAQAVSPNTTPWDVRLADINDDGDLDILVTTDFVLFMRIIVMNNDGAGGFTPVEGPILRDPRGSIATGDLDADGDLDIIVGHGRGLEILLNDGSGMLTDLGDLDAPNIRAIAAGDLNGDGLTDVATIREWTHDLVVFANTGDGVLEQVAVRRILEEFSLSELRAIEVADMDQDGLDDVVIGIDLDDRSIRVRVLLTQGPCPGCRADIDGDGELTLFDFLAFQNLFDAGDPAADFDGDGGLTLFDFLAFQNEFDAGCE